MPSHGDPGRALAAGMAELKPGLGRRGVNEIDQTLPGPSLRIVPKAEAAGCDARIRRYARRLAEHEPRAAERAAAEMHQMEVVRHAVDGRIHRHRRDHDAVRQRDAAHRIRCEHRRHRGAVGNDVDAAARREPAFVILQPYLVANAQVFVTDALRARQQRVHELLRLERVGVAAADHLEPFHGIAGRVLDAGDVDGAHLFISGKDRRYLVPRGTEVFELPRQLDGVFERQLGAGADGEMRGVRRVPHQHDLAVAVEMTPLTADQAVEVEPSRTAQVPGVAHQLGAIEDLAEKFLAERDRTRLVGLVEAMRREDVLRRLYNKSRCGCVEFVDMGLEPAVLGAAEIEGEGVVRLIGAEPDKTVRSHDQIGLESITIAIANLGIDAVGGNDEVGIRKFEIGIDLALEDQLDAELLATRLQDVKELLAADADKAVAGGAHAPALDQHFDIVPVVERGFNVLRGLGVPGAHILHGGVGKHHAPAERVVGLVALDHGHMVSRIFLLHQQAEIEPGRAAADANDAHIVILHSRRCEGHKYPSRAAHMARDLMRLQLGSSANHRISTPNMPLNRAAGRGTPPVAIRWHESSRCQAQGRRLLPGSSKGNKLWDSSPKTSRI